MKDIGQLQKDLLKEIAAIQDLKALEALRVEALGKKGKISLLVKSLGTESPDERREKGKVYNELREEIQTALEARKHALESLQLQQRLASETIDITLSPTAEKEGTIHPLSQTLYEVMTIFKRMGFAVAEGPNIEDDEHNFTALNIPPDHPARQEADTFYLPPKQDGTAMVLRTHTSPVQIRTMRKNKPPIWIITPGRVYRSDFDATHTPTFHQIEGLVVDKNIHMGHLKGCLQKFFNEFFECEDLPMRFRPGFFPFTEPSAEVDIGCRREGGEMIIGKGNNWLEILGCGMVHPKVLKNCGIDPEVYQGFAFGMGIERIAMLKKGIPDLRAFYEAEVRWLGHYGLSPFTALSAGRGL